MRALIEQEIMSVYGGVEYIEEKEAPSLIDDFLFFVAFGAATGGFGTFITAFVFTQSLPVLIAATMGGIILGIGICIGTEVVSP